MPRTAWLVEPRGAIPYDVANGAMHDLAEARLRDEIPDTLILLEHPPVFTAGRRAHPEELLWTEQEVEARGGLVRKVDRGGSYTFHGPGQLVAYPVLSLGSKPDAAAYLRRLEEIVIRSGKDLGLELERRDDVQTGVWRGDEKVCAIGVRLMRTRITVHGLALNCNTDLSWFSGIVPCGLPEHGVTSLSQLLGRRVSVPEVRPLVRRHAASVLDLDLVPASASMLRAFSTAPVGVRVTP